MSKRQGPPKHQNRYAWKPHAGHKINETEPGGRFRPLSEITGVCPRCRDQIDWKRRYGKYKSLVEPRKCQKCGKRSVRQAYHNICTACSKDLGLCAKCCCPAKELVGRDITEVECERKAIEEAVNSAPERHRRSLLRLVNNGKAADARPLIQKIEKIAEKKGGKIEGELDEDAESVDEYAENSSEHDSEEDEDLI